MSSPYFAQCSAVATRSGTRGRTLHTPGAASLRSRLTDRQRTSGVSAVKVEEEEEEEAKISGNVDVAPPPFD